MTDFGKAPNWLLVVTILVVMVFAGTFSDGAGVPAPKTADIQARILGFWMKVAPPELVRLNPGYLPEGLDLPEKNAGDEALLAFYLKWVPGEVTALVDRLAGLRYPVLDTQDLKEQLGMSDGGWKAGDDRLIINLRVSDFPIVSLEHALDAAVIRELSKGFKGCWDSYRECREKGSAAAQAQCEREYQACADGVSIQIFVAMNPGLIGKPWPPEPPAPEPGPGPMP